ncbi:PREDICTED: VIN3-like protein 2 isoform X2 [Nelumbo nucifera]|uniref:VIN3-like protein 2 isoform X2 n=2 Tax=Nelumbo nucifera TaxID=4432 RepID=A0A1U7ZI82_NELNU|nr:PREDICTED: VIN3-like protein 2 isoform X2 [Nelumbo nucifera]DAD45808.1 TPA_asm: hypothetical protein HUJ06_004038 [Nelumbo nucifera]
MDSSYEGFVFDPSKCSKLSMEEKRELVYEISKWSHGAPEMLQSWSRRELLQILCAEMGKERKYTGLTKLKMIEHLLKIVSEKKSRKREEPETKPSPINDQSTAKRQRKTDHPSRLPIATNNISSNGDGDPDDAIYCQNSACRAAMHRQDPFCKRCSCCICCKYDDNKDPSLWLVCSSEPPYQGDSCGMSCHLDCALMHKRAGIAKDGHHARLDGSFYCISCGKVNDLLGCWRKQLIIAKDTRRVDILCYRVSLSQKLLSGTEKYQKLYEIVVTAAKKLEAEVGPLAGLPVKMGRGIVNRLSSGPEVQKFCAYAVESLDSMLSSGTLHYLPNSKTQESKLISPNLIKFEDISPTSLTVVLGSRDAPLESGRYVLWHRKADVLDYPTTPTCTLFKPNTRFSVLDLAPATEYVFKAICFHDKTELGMSEVRVTTTSTGSNLSKSAVVNRSQSPTTNSSSVSNPSSEGDESNNIITYDDASKDASDCQNMSTGLGEEETQGDVASALDEEHAIAALEPMPNSTTQTDSQRGSTNSTENQMSDVKADNKHSPEEGRLVEETSTDTGLHTPVGKELDVVPYGHLSDAVVPITPCKLEISKDGLGRSGKPKPSSGEVGNQSGKMEEPQAGSSSKQRSGVRWNNDGCASDGSLEREYEYCVKIIRWLECEGHIEKNFREKFLTWYSLRATIQERRIVKVFVDTMIDDPSCLAGQLVDTFSECISAKRPLAVPTGFCMKLWH